MSEETQDVFKCKKCGNNEVNEFHVQDEEIFCKKCHSEISEDRKVTPRQKRIRELEEKAKRLYLDKKEWWDIEDALQKEEIDELQKLHKMEDAEYERT